MSKIKVNEIEAATGSTVTIPTGQTFTVTDGIPATNLSGTIADARLPTVPVTKGGTGLTSLGSAGQVVQVNSGGNALEFAAISAGGLKQVVQGTFDSAASTSSHNTMVDTGLTVNITPTSSSNKILCFFNANVQMNTGQYSGGLSIVRNSTAIRTANSGNARATAQFWSPSDSYHMNHFTGMVLDSPNTTSQTTYKVQFASGYSGQTVYINRGYANNNHFDSTSTIIVMEVAV